MKCGDNNCTETVDHSRVKVEEGGMKAIFLNPNRSQYVKGRIDKCLVMDGVRADYFVSGESKTVIVELKGKNLEHACDQVFAAARHENVKPHISGQIGFLIICSRFPSLTTSVQLAKVKAKKIYGANFHVYTKEREVDMSMF